MGCNAHTHIEVKKDGKWLHFAAPDVERDYILYAVMAGVRLDDFRESTRELIHPVARVHEMPEDISEVTAFCYRQDSEDYAVHDLAVLHAEDLVKLQKQIRELAKGPMGHGFNYDLEADVFHTYIGGNSIARHDGWDDVRVIMWFDN